MIFNHGAVTPYFPYWVYDDQNQRKKNPKWNRGCGYILDIKDNGKNVQQAVAAFLPPLLTKIKANIPNGTIQIVATVPGHKEGSTSPALVDLTKVIAARLQTRSLPYLVKRTRTIDKLAHGGNRSESVHIDSMVVTNHLEIEGKVILLVDDVMTTGNSMIAAAKLLLGAGARVVHLIALGQTSN